MTELASLSGDALRDIAAAASPEALEEIRVRVLGRRGVLTEAMKELGRLAPRSGAGAGPN